MFDFFIYSERVICWNNSMADMRAIVTSMQETGLLRVISILFYEKLASFFNFANMKKS